MTQEIIEMARQAGFGEYVISQDPRFQIFAKLVAAKEQARCCSIIYGYCGSDNVAERTVQAIKRGEA